MNTLMRLQAMMVKRALLRSRLLRRVLLNGAIFIMMGAMLAGLLTAALVVVLPSNEGMSLGGGTTVTHVSSPNDQTAGHDMGSSVKEIRKKPRGENSWRLMALKVPVYVLQLALRTMMPPLETLLGYLLVQSGISEAVDQNLAHILHPDATIESLKEDL